MVKLAMLSIAATIAAGLPHSDVLRSDPPIAPIVDGPETACELVLDRLDDLASNPASQPLLDATTRRLIQGIALCRSGHVEEGAAIVRRALPAISRID